jgi:magnesium transporter
MVRKVLVREARIGLFIGIALALLSGLLAYLISGGEGAVAGVMALAVFANLSIATFAGAGIPILLRHLGLDPALASNIFLTFVSDMVGFAGFLLIATALL